eukprot:SAG11_NODE_17277_length_523_cov_0.867925_1_plen_70_part_10
MAYIMLPIGRRWVLLTFPSEDFETKAYQHTVARDEIQFSIKDVAMKTSIYPKLLVVGYLSACVGWAFSNF